MSEIADLLEKLKQLDVATYEAIAKGIPLQPRGQYMVFDRGEVRACQYHEAYMPFGNLLPEVAGAWLQFCIQRAISAKGYHLLQSQDVDDGQYYAEISKLAPGYDGDTKTEKHLYLIAEGKGPSPCHALLSAYIACLEGQP